jgi:hypothetical protein
MRFRFETKHLTVTQTVPIILLIKIIDQIREVLEKGQVRSKYPKPASVHGNLMTVEQAKGVCKDRSKWKEVISAYPKGKRAWYYVCMYVKSLLFDCNVVPN